MQWLDFNLKSSLDFGVFLTNAGVYRTPERKYQSVEIQGRNGNLIIEDGNYGNVTVEYPCVVYRNFDQNFMGFADFLLAQRGYYRLEDTFVPDRFRLATVKSVSAVKISPDGRIGTFRVAFDCKPQWFLKSGEISVTYTALETQPKIYNLTNQEAKPLIRAYGTGSFSIGDYTVAINAANDYTDIDCETQEAYKGSTNCNGNIVLDEFPVLVAGANAITMTGITRLDITPRWWVV